MQCNAACKTKKDGISKGKPAWLKKKLPLGGDYQRVTADGRRFCPHCWRPVRGVWGACAERSGRAWIGVFGAGGLGRGAVEGR